MEAHDEVDDGGPSGESVEDADDSSAFGTLCLWRTHLAWEQSGVSAGAEWLLPKGLKGVRGVAPLARPEFFNLNILTLQTWHLNGSLRCSRAVWMLWTRHFLQSTLCPHGWVSIVALDVMHWTQASSLVSAVSGIWSSKLVSKTSILWCSWVSSFSVTFLWLCSWCLLLNSFIL